MSEEISVEEGAGHSLSRRTVLKGAAVVGGTVWVAPVIESFTSKAAAASANPNYTSGTFTCSYALLVYQDASGKYWAVKYSQPTGTCTSVNTDGGTSGTNASTVCGGNTFAISSTTGTKNEITINGTVIPDGDCSNFYSTGTTISFTGTSGTWVVALIHDGTSYNWYCNPTSPTTFTCQP